MECAYFILLKEESKSATAFSFKPESGISREDAIEEYLMLNWKKYPFFWEIDVKSSVDSASPVESSPDSTASAPFVYENTINTTGLSVLDLFDLNKPRGTSLGQSSLQSGSWPSSLTSPPSISPVNSNIRHQGIRPPCFSPFNNLNFMDTSRGMPLTNSAGYDSPVQSFSSESPVYVSQAIRGSPPYSDCSSPLVEHTFPKGWSPRSTSPSDSDTSSNDLSDLINSLSLSQSIGVHTPPTELELMNLHALHTLTSGAGLRSSVQVPPPNLGMIYSQNHLPPITEDTNLITGKYIHNRAEHFKQAKPKCSWSGELPPRFLDFPSTVSCKVFFGGVPWDVPEETLIGALTQFGKVKIEWPDKEEAASQQKGYAYIIFESEKQVKALLSSCTQNFSSEDGWKWYFRISSRKIKSKAVQVIPWSPMESNFVIIPSQKLDASTTVFVGALHGMLNAEGLFKIMDDTFGGVIYAGIDTDKFRYPIGSARVTFNNRTSYMKAIQTAFMQIECPKFKKKVQLLPYLEDAPCSCCLVQQGPYFCIKLKCFRYFCRTCWDLHLRLEPNHRSTDEPLTRSSKNNKNSTIIMYQ